MGGAGFRLEGQWMTMTMFLWHVFDVACYSSTKTDCMTAWAIVQVSSLRPVCLVRAEVHTRNTSSSFMHKAVAI